MHSRSATSRKLSCTRNFCFQTPRGVPNTVHEVREAPICTLYFAVINDTKHTRKRTSASADWPKLCGDIARTLTYRTVHLKKNYWYDWQQNTEQTHWKSYPLPERHFASAVISPFTCEGSNQRKRMATAALFIVGYWNRWGVEINQNLGSSWGPFYLNSTHLDSNDKASRHFQTSLNGGDWLSGKGWATNYVQTALGIQLMIMSGRNGDWRLIPYSHVNVRVDGNETNDFKSVLV